MSVAAPAVGAGIRVSRFSGDVDLGLQRRIEQAVQIGVKNVALKAEELLPKAMQASAWGFTGSTRDIVSTGRLMGSMQVLVSGDRVQVSYGEPYAALVHYGGYIQPYGNREARPVYLPGRPWVDAVLQGGGPVESIDYYQIYYEALVQAFQKG